MAFELDHFFILTDPGASQADRLLDLGLTEGTSNDHPGQGTANRRFFFSNSMLEFLYIQDLDEANDGPASGLNLAERLADPGASPFGLIVRGGSASSDVPFPGWSYFPDYLQSGEYIHVGKNSDVLNEPLCFFLPVSATAALTQTVSVEPFSTVTSVKISLPPDEISSTLNTLNKMDQISIRSDSQHLMEVYFGHGINGRKNDFRPELPLIFHW